MRVGIGFDSHPFGQDGELMLAGVSIGSPGLEGWSDGDVLSHAVIDAVLGAAAMGDIGQHFPPDEVEQGVASLELVQRTVGILADWEIVNIDATVILQGPKVAPFRDEIRKNLAAALGIDSGAVSIKATTTDGLGAIGRSEGVAALAVAMVRPR